MKFRELLAIVGDEMVFETGLLLAGDEDAADVRRQLSRWCRTGRIVQLRRGLYALAEPYRSRRPEPFVLANRLVAGSYVSLESALAAQGLIPEQVPVVTSVTVGRGGRWDTPLGSFRYRHVQPDWFHGYRAVEVGAGARALVATPEKALLDKVYLTTGGDSPAFLDSLRLQRLEHLDFATLHRLATASGKPKLQRAASAVAKLAREQIEAYEPL
jgi:predicted transcriptional regulator of viral defense system